MKLRDILNPKNIKNFINGNYHYFTPNAQRPAHITEQALYRAYLCQECLRKGKCVVCGCKTPNMFFSPTKTDSKKRWGKMLPADKWLTYKATSPHWQAIKKELDKFIKHAGLEGLRYEPEVLGGVSRVQDLKQREISRRRAVDSLTDDSHRITLLSLTQGQEDRGDTEESLPQEEIQINRGEGEMDQEDRGVGGEVDELLSKEGTEDTTDTSQ